MDSMVLSTAQKEELLALMSSGETPSALRESLKTWAQTQDDLPAEAKRRPFILQRVLRRDNEKETHMALVPGRLSFLLDTCLSLPDLDMSDLEALEGTLNVLMARVQEAKDEI
jgi:hypothetical protein